MHAKNSRNYLCVVICTPRKIRKHVYVVTCTPKTHTHACTRAFSPHIIMYAQINRHIHAFMHIHTSAHTHYHNTCIHIYTQKHTHARTNIPCVCTYVNLYVCVYGYICAQGIMGRAATYVLKCMHSQTYMVCLGVRVYRVYTHRHPHVSSIQKTNVYTRAYIHTKTDAEADTRQTFIGTTEQTHVHTNKHMQTQHVKH